MNQTDLQRALPTADLQRALGLDGCSDGGGAGADLLVRAFPASVVNGEGYTAAFQWISNYC